MLLTTLVIIAAVVALAVILALVATNPMMRRREDDAIAAVKDQLSNIELIEPRTTAMGTDPEEAGGVRGMACLGMSGAELLAVTWARGATWRIPRASVLSVETPADDPRTAPKATITITYARPTGDEATAMFRLRDAADWLRALGYELPEEPPDDAPRNDGGPEVAAPGTDADNGDDRH